MERKQLSKLNTNQLVAYWNVLQIGPRNQTSVRHTKIVSDLLKERSVPHEPNKMIETVLVDRLTHKITRSANGQPFRRKVA